MPARFVFTTHSLTYFLRLRNVSGTAEREIKRKTFQNGENEISTAQLQRYFDVYFSNVQKLSDRGGLIKFNVSQDHIPTNEYQSEQSTTV